MTSHRPPIRSLSASLLAACLTFACNGPFVLLPGGALEGETRPAPEDWGFAGDHGMAQLETRSEDPYSVNLAYTIVGGVLYVNAGDSETRWVENMTADPAVRLRLEGTIYALCAERVEDANEIDAFADAWTSQSWFRRDPRELDRVWLYRLVPR